MANIERRHWDRPDPEPPERVVLWRGGLNPDLPRWEQMYVRAEQLEGAVEALREIATWAEYGYQDLNAGGVLSCVKKRAKEALTTARGR